MGESHESTGARTESVERLRCPRGVREGLDEWTARTAQALGENLAGIYVYGSLARGCFHPATSDVDVVVVTEGPCSEAVISDVLRAHEEAGVPIDATFVTRSQMDVNETPTPVEFVVKPVGDQRLVRSREGLRDFLLQRQDVYECDAAVVGEPAREVVKPVPWDALARCLHYLFPHILPRFKNPALMLSRMAYAFASRKLCSKRTAGDWARGVLDEEWRPLIEQALAKYAGGVPDDRGPDERLRAFAEYCTRFITEVRGCGGAAGD